MSRWNTIVVGVDGSPGSRKALTWAAAEAAEHGSNLIVLNVWEHTLLPPAGSVSVSERYVPDSSQRTAAKVLLEESVNADLLMVGKRGHGGFTGLVLGSVSQHVAAYAKCPVTVVH